MPLLAGPAVPAVVPVRLDGISLLQQFQRRRSRLVRRRSGFRHDLRILVHFPVDSEWLGLATSQA